jgi:putative ABC transport system permease protein
VNPCITPFTMIRSILRHKGSFLLNLLGLTLGVSCFLFTLSYVFYERSYDRFQVKRDRIARLVTDIHSGGVDTRAVFALGALCDQLPGQFPEIERMVRFVEDDEHTGLRWKPLEPPTLLKKVYYTDENAFSTFSYRMTEGDARTALSAPNCIVLTESVKRRFFGKGSAMGQTMVQKDRPLKVTGVMADLPGNTDLPFDALISLKTLKPEEASDWCICYILFKRPGVISTWEGKMDTLTKKHINRQLDPDGVTTLQFHAQPLTTLHFSELRPRDTPKGNLVYVNTFFVTGILVLLIACINSINLSIVQSFSRVMDVTIRKIYGAGRARLIGRHVLESMFTAGVAVILALGLVWLLLPVFGAMVNRQLSAADVFNWKVLGAAAAGIGLLGVGGALYTAVYLNKVTLADVLRAKNGKVGGLRILPQVMLGFQFFITVGMLVAALATFRQVRYLRSVPLGFNTDNILVVHLPQYEHSLEGDRYLRNVLARNPHVLGIATGDDNSLPGYGEDIDVWRYRENGVKVKKTIYHIEVDANYLRLLQIPVIKGEGFPDVPDSLAKNNAIVTAGFARKQGWTQPIGETFEQEDGQKKTVIGVVPDFHYNSLHQAISPLVLFQEVGQPIELYLRVDQARIANVIKSVGAEWRKTFPELPLVYTFLDEHLAQQYKDDYNLLSLLMTLTVLMIAISCMGLIAYISFLLRMARGAIAIRRVIGASFRDIYGLFVPQFVWLLGIALVTAGPLAWWWVEMWLGQFAYHVSPRLLDLGVGIVAMGVIVGLIVLRFTMQSLRVNPARVLREN